MSDETYDFERAALLLEIVHRTLNMPRLKSLHDAAMAELEAMANPPVEEPVEEEAA